MNCSLQCRENEIDIKNMEAALVKGTDRKQDSVYIQSPASYPCLFCLSNSNKQYITVDNS